MNLKQKYWFLSLLLAFGLWLGLTSPSYAAQSPPSPEAKVVHVLNRLSFGPRPGDIETVKSRGIEAYIQSQLSPDSIAQSQTVTQQLASLPTLRMSPVEIIRKYQQQQNRVNKKIQQTSPEMVMAGNQQNAEIRMARRQVLEEATQGRLVRAISSS